MSKFARSSKNCEKMEKSPFWLKLIKSSVRGDKRVPSKDSCDFCDFSKDCEKLEKPQFLLKLIKTSVRGKRRVPRKKKLQFLRFVQKLRKTGEIAVFAKIDQVPKKKNVNDFCDFSKNCEKLDKSQFLLQLLNSSAKGGRRVPSKNCDFCNFCDFSTKCEKLEKLQFLLN